MELEAYLKLFSIKNPTFLADTPRASLWHVDSQGGPAVLKVFTAQGLKAGEAVGAKLLRPWDGDGAVKVIGESDDAILMEWLDGQTLAESITNGQDEEAAQAIAELALRLQRSPTEGFIRLEDHFGRALASANINNFPSPLQPAFASAQALFIWLMETTKQPRLMHGDLNFDNIIQSERGWLAIDPKGIVADPCYEFGVAFRCPYNDPAHQERIAAPERILNLARLLASQTNLNEERILQFGFVHVAMSLAYHFDRKSELSEADLAIFLSFDALSLSPPY